MTGRDQPVAAAGSQPAPHLQGPAQQRVPQPLGLDWQHPLAHQFQRAMNEDFGTPEAVAVLFELASEVNRSRSAKDSALLKALGGVLGLLQDDPKRILQAGIE